MLAPSWSKLYTKFHSSTMLSLAGTIILSSSAIAAVSNLALGFVSTLKPRRESGSSGGGRIGEAVRWVRVRGLKTPSTPLALAPVVGNVCEW